MAGHIAPLAMTEANDHDATTGQHIRLRSDRGKI